MPNPTPIHPTIKHSTSCRHCKFTLQAAPLEIPLIGQAPGDRLKRFVMELMKHLHGKHPEEIDTLQRTVEDFTGLLILNSFETTDPGLTRRIDQSRADVHKRTRRNKISDADILDIVSRIGLDPDDEATVGQLIRGVRDLYEETGDWSPAKQAEKTLLTA